MVKINEVYKPLYTSKKRYFFVTGGRGSGKSFAVHDYILRLTYEQDQGILFTRYTMTSAETSIIPEFKQAIERLGVEEHFHITTKDIYNKLTGSFIWFRGIKAGSNAQKANLKSLAGVSTWVVEEGEDFQDERAFDTIDDSIRTKVTQNRVIWIQNPSTRDHFIYKRWIEFTSKQIEIEGNKVTVSDHPDVEHIHTTYLINQENLTESWLKKAAQARKDKPKYYVQNYLGGWLEKAEGVIFENWKTGDFDDSLPCIYGLDFGFSNDPSCLVKVAINQKHRKLYVEECFYLPGLDTDQIDILLRKFVKNRELIIADSAEPRLIYELQKRGLNIFPCVKGKDSVTGGINLMKSFEIVVTPDSTNYKRELNNYAWDATKSYPIDDWNHAIDPTRYVLAHIFLKKHARKVKKATTWQK